MHACLSEKSLPGSTLTGCDRFQASPVLFVHGSGLGSSTWDEMIRRFNRAGYPDSYLNAVDLIPNDGDNILAAEKQISAAMNRLLEDTGRAHSASGCTGIAPAKGAIVAHSMGAVSGRWYATKVAPKKVSALISLAGSNHGTDALCRLSGDGDRQMCPAYSENDRVDAVQVMLNGTGERPVDETPYGIGKDTDPEITVPPDNDRQILYLTIRIEPDEWIVPASSAMLNGAGGIPIPGTADLPVSETSDGNFIFGARTSHDYLPSHPDVIRFVWLALRIAK